MYFTIQSVDHGHLAHRGCQGGIWGGPGVLYIDQGYLEMEVDLAQIDCFIYHLDQNFKEILNLVVLWLYLSFIEL